MQRPHTAAGTPDGSTPRRYTTRHGTAWHAAGWVLKLKVQL